MTDAEQIAERLADIAFRMTHPGLPRQMSGIVADCKADISQALLDAGLGEAVAALEYHKGMDDAGGNYHCKADRALAALRGEKCKP